MRKITKNIITLQRGRFRCRSKRRFNARSALQIIHTIYNNDTQRINNNKHKEHNAGRAAGRCAAHHQNNLQPPQGILEHPAERDAQSSKFSSRDETRTVPKGRADRWERIESFQTHPWLPSESSALQSYDIFSAGHVLGKE